MISIKEIKKIIDDRDRIGLEKLARRSYDLTRRYFGNAVSIYAPLYISNYCDSGCVYCGFNAARKIKRRKLTPAQLDGEMSTIEAAGIQNILLLTGGSRRHAPPAYIRQAVEKGKKYFPAIGIEVYPMERAEYRMLYEAGVDSVTMYQETYDRKLYGELHPTGKKKDYDFRYSAPERMAESGIRTISMGVLLGLAEVAPDIHSLFCHLEWMQRSFPGVEYSVSFPRIVKVPGSGFEPLKVSDSTLLKLICLTRILFPRFGINLSTRETAFLRDRVLEMGVTRISAASKTAVGGYSLRSDADTQFEVKDKRSVKQIIGMLKRKNLDPVLTEWRRIDNKP